MSIRCEHGAGRSTDASVGSRHVDDEPALEALRNGDEAGFETLVGNWLDDVYDHLCRSGATRVSDDDLRAVFLAAKARVGERSDVTFGAAAMAAAVAFSGFADREVDSDLQISPHTAMRLSRGTDVAALTADGTIATLLWDAAAMLGAEVAVVMDLHWRHGLSSREIAYAIGASQPSVDGIISKAPQGFVAALRTRLLWSAGEPEHATLADDLRRAGVRSYGVTAVRVIHQHGRSCARCRSGSLIALPPIDLFSSLPLDRPSTITLPFGQPAHEPAQEPAPSRVAPATSVRNRTPLVLSGIGAAIVVLLIATVALTRWPNEEAEIGVASISGESRPPRSTTTVEPTTTTTAPEEATTTTEPERTTAPGENTTTDTDTDTAVTTPTSGVAPALAPAPPPPAPAPPPPAPPTTAALQVDGSISVDPGSVDSGFAKHAVLLSWSVSADRNVRVEVLGPEGTLGTGPVGSVSVCPLKFKSDGTCPAPPGTYTYTLSVYEDSGLVLNQQATLQIS